MPIVTFNGQKIECKEGDNLRKVLLRHNVKIYNGPMKYLNCRGLGTCGTCAVRINGSTSDPTSIELWRLGFPPHRKGNGLRLACQVKIIDDLEVEKLTGLWGQEVTVVE